MQAGYRPTPASPTGPSSPPATPAADGTDALLEDIDACLDESALEEPSQRSRHQGSKGQKP